MPATRFRLIAVAAITAAFGLPVPAQTPAAKPRIEKAADLPRFEYRLDGRVEDLIADPAKFAPFAAAVRRDAQSVLDRYDIADKATERSLVGAAKACGAGRDLFGGAWRDRDAPGRNR